MGRFARSLTLAKQSWAVLRSNPELSLFPLISGIVSLVVMASFAVPGFFLFQGVERDGQMGPLQYLFMFVFYVVSYFVVIFFNAGMISCAHQTFSGHRATFKDGMNAASQKIGSIFVYAVIAATVGMILQMISERAGLVGRIVSKLLGMGWTILTYFVVPVLVVEGKSPIDAIKESGEVLKKTWGEGLVGAASMNIITMLLTFAILIPMVAGFVVIGSGFMVPGIALIVLSVILLIVLSLISAALTGVYRTALYIYARTGQVPTQYEPALIQHAFVYKGQRDY